MELFLVVMVFKKSWYKGNNGILLTMKSSEAVLNDRSISRSLDHWSWMISRGIQSLTGLCCGLAVRGIMPMSEVEERCEKIKKWQQVAPQKIIKNHQI